MIRINLLKVSTRKKSESKPFSVPKPVIITFVVLIIAAGGYLGWKNLPQKAPEVKKIEVVETKPSPPPPVHSSPNMIEEVVREVGDSRNTTQNGVLMIPYSDMTFAEKVNYEVLFGKTVFQLLSKAIPPGIGLKNLEIDNFQTVYAVGIGDTKELISSTFLNLKNEKLELLQQPLSYITANAGKGYRFVVTCKASFGVDNSDPFQAWDYLGNRDNMVDVLKKIQTIATANNVIFKENPSPVSSVDVGSYRRYSYKFTGKGDYKSFVAFILALHNEKVPCAFKKVQLKAGASSSVGIDADILLTVKE